MILESRAPFVLVVPALAPADVVVDATGVLPDAVVVVPEVPPIALVI